MKNLIPSNLQGILWSKNVKGLDLQKNKNYIIHQILANGTLQQIKWLLKTYNKRQVTTSFEKYPEKDYTPQSYNFIKNYVLKITKDLDIRKYVQTFPRSIR